ncbi:MAG TPA: kelch repeat-containing protein, partial [Thermoplasmata archaeon]
MAFVPGANYTLLWGGEDLTSQTPLNDTWTFSNGTWANLPISGGPPGCAGSAPPVMTYDVNNRSVLLIDGCDGPFGATWTFASNTWTRQAALPPGVSGHVTEGVSDPADGFVLFIG